MPKTRRYKKSRRTTRRKTVRGGTKSYVSNPVKHAIVSAVKQVNYCAQETKYVSEQITGGTVFNGAIASTGEIYRAIPACSQGTDDYQRIGDTIQPTRLELEFTFGFSSADFLARDVSCDLFLLRSKQIKDWNFYGSVPITQLMDNGAGSGVYYDGTIQTAANPVYNKQFSVLHHDRFRLGKATGGFDTFSVAYPSHSVPMMTVHKKTFHIKLPKCLSYSQSSATTPTNDMPFWVFGFTPNNDGGAFITPTISVWCKSKMWYKDS